MLKNEICSQTITECPQGTKEERFTNESTERVGWFRLVSMLDQPTQKALFYSHFHLTDKVGFFYYNQGSITLTKGLF